MLHIHWKWKLNARLPLHVDNNTSPVTGGPDRWCRDWTEKYQPGTGRSSGKSWQLPITGVMQITHSIACLSNWCTDEVFGRFSLAFRTPRKFVHKNYAHFCRIRNIHFPCRKLVFNCRKCLCWLRSGEANTTSFCWIHSTYASPTANKPKHAQLSIALCIFILWFESMATLSLSLIQNFRISVAVHCSVDTTTDLNYILHKFIAFETKSIKHYFYFH